MEFCQVQFVYIFIRIKHLLLQKEDKTPTRKRGRPRVSINTIHQ
jgi:hypothetical protein